MNKNLVKQPSDRLIYLDILRIIASFAVVMIHTTASRMHIYAPTLSFEWIIYVFFNNISRWAVPVFTMISGLLFLDNNKNLKIRIFYKKNIFRIITAYIFWIVIYALYNKPNSIEEFIDTDAYHLWFLPMLIGLYMITPVLRKITEDKKITLYFLVLSVLFIITLPTLFEFKLFKGFEVIYEQFTRGFCVKYSFYFVAGYYLANKNFSKKVTVLIYSLGIISFLMLPVLTVYSLYTHGFYSEFMDNFSIPVMFQSIFVFIIIKNICNKKHFNDKITKLIIRFSKYTFGIYLVHVLILEILTDFEIIPISCHVSISPIITNLLVFLISLLISAILNHISILKKYIV